MSARENADNTNAVTTEAERLPRSRLLERATLGLGGLVALGVALPVTGLAVLPTLFGRRRRAVDTGSCSPASASTASS